MVAQQKEVTNRPKLLNEKAAESIKRNGFYFQIKFEGPKNGKSRNRDSLYWQ